MSIFKNTLTGDITTVFGPVHDHFLTRPEQELVLDDRDAQGNGATQVQDPVDEISQASASSGTSPKDNKGTATSDAADGADNLEEQ